MRKFTLSILLLAFAGAAFAAEPQTFELKDAKAMTAKDGRLLMMKNNAIWKTITEHGTLKPGH